jgi:hypothetical protein
MSSKKAGLLFPKAPGSVVCRFSFLIYQQNFFITKEIMPHHSAQQTQSGATLHL